MQAISTINALVVGALAGAVAFCGSVALTVWRRRHRDLADRPRSAAGTLAKGLLAAGVTSVLLCLVYRETASREGVLCARDVLTIRAAKDMKPAYLSRQREVSAGDILVRFEAPDSEDRAEALRLRCKALQAEKAALDNAPLEIDGELVRRHQRAVADLRQWRASLEKLLPALETVRRLRLENRLHKNERIRGTEVTLTGRRGELAQSEARVEYLGQMDEAVQSLAGKRAATTIEASQARSERRVAEARAAKLRGEIELHQLALKRLRDDRDEYEALMARQCRALSEKVDRARKALAAAQKHEKALVARLDEDRRRAERQRGAEVRRSVLKAAEVRARLAGLRRALTIRAPFDGVVLYRAAAPRMEYNEAPLLILGSQLGFVARVRIPAAEAASLERAGAVTLESSEAAVQRRFAGRVESIRPLPFEDDRVLAELSCRPPDESIRRLAREERVPVELRWRPPIYLHPLFLAGAFLHVLAAGAATWAAVLRRKRAARAGSDHARSGQTTGSRTGPPAAEVGSCPGEMAEFGAQGAMLRTLGDRLRRAVEQRKVPGDLLSAVEWALDRHHVRAVHLIGAALRGDGGEPVVPRVRRLQRELREQEEAEEPDGANTAALRRRLDRLLRLLLPELEGPGQATAGGGVQQCEHSYLSQVPE